MKTSTNKKTALSSAELRQKVIYYQNEAAKYKFLSEKYELMITEALQTKPIADENEAEKGNMQQKTECTSYFNYSLIQDTDTRPFIYGNFILKNTGNTPLYTPMICLKVNEPTLLTISGKIGDIHDADNKLINSFTEWIYLHSDWRNKWLEHGQLWLKPKQTEVIEPGEKLIFSGFDISYKEKTSFKPVIIEGYCYFKELTGGIKSLNSISISTTE